MNIEIISENKVRRKLGSELQTGDFIWENKEIYLIINKSAYAKGGYGDEPWAVSLSTHRLTYLNPQEEYMVVEQVRPLQFRFLYNE